MRYEDRRKELGRMLMDIAKYLATVGLIGSFLTKTLAFEVGLLITFVVLVLTIIAFYTIPPKKGNTE